MPKRIPDGTICSESGCNSPAHARTWCKKHYNMHYAHGLPPIIRTDESRFLENIDVNGPTMPHMETPCHIWLGASNKDLYGIFYLGNEKTMLAHRWAYLHWVGEIPSEKPHVLHHCDNPPCVNPTHLRAGTVQDNMDDMKSRKRHRFGETSVQAKLTNEQVMSIRERCRDGESLSSIGRSYGMHHSHIGEICVGNLWAHLPCYEANIKPPKRALRESDVLDIRQRYRDGEIQSSIAKSYGISRTHVSAICLGQKWKHLPI